MLPPLRSCLQTAPGLREVKGGQGYSLANAMAFEREEAVKFGELGLPWLVPRAGGQEMARGCMVRDLRSL